MRVIFQKDWSRPGETSHKKDEIVEIEEGLSWELALMGIVKFKKDDDDPELEKAKQTFKVSKKKKQ